MTSKNDVVFTNTNQMMDEIKESYINDYEKNGSGFIAFEVFAESVAEIILKHVRK